jgi:hypothetical protein
MCDVSEDFIRNLIIESGFNPQNGWMHSGCAVDAQWMRG